MKKIIPLALFAISLCAHTGLSGMRKKPEERGRSHDSYFSRRRSQWRPHDGGTSRRTKYRPRFTCRVDFSKGLVFPCNPTFDEQERVTEVSIKVYAREIKLPILLYKGTGRIDCKRVYDLRQLILEEVEKKNKEHSPRLSYDENDELNLIEFVIALPRKNPFSSEQVDLSSPAQEENGMYEEFFVWNPKEDGYNLFYQTWRPAVRGD